MTTSHNQSKLYLLPVQDSNIPEALLNLLNGKDIESKVGIVFRLSTVDEQGWPHAALLSVGEILAVDPHTMRIIIWPTSSTAKNMERFKRLTLEAIADDGMYEIRLNLKKLADMATDDNLSIFEGEVHQVRLHKVEYARVTSGITYELLDQQKVLDRWKVQIETLKATTMGNAHRAEC